MKRFVVVVVAVGLFALPPESGAWESATSSAGITEQAALSSPLHQQLTEQLGQRGGLFTPMRVPRQDATALYEVLDKLNPADGHVPDRSGRQLALNWLAAGTALADTPAEHAIHHFYDPVTKRGVKMTGGPRGLARRITSITLRERLVSGGMAAPDWLISAENPMSASAFAAQYKKAVNAKTPAERERHAAAALLAAGAIVHVVGDMASPAHVRSDLESFFDKLSGDQTDVGSRFERLAALAYGRLGVKRPADAVKRDRLRDFITAGDGQGLADIVSTKYFSKNTLPRSVRIRRGESSASIARKIKAKLVRPSPAPAGPFDLDAAKRDGGARLESATGVCLAHYHVQAGKLSWSIPDACALEQIGELLPIAAAYGSGVLQFLFRGALSPAAAGKSVAIKTDGIGLAEGTLTAYWDDELGVRTEYQKLDRTAAAKAGGTIQQVPLPPANAKAMAVLYEGSDENGEPVVAALYTTLPLAKAKK